MSAARPSSSRPRAWRRWTTGWPRRRARRACRSMSSTGPGNRTSSCRRSSNAIRSSSPSPAAGPRPFWRGGCARRSSGCCPRVSAGSPVSPRASAARFAASGPTPRHAGASGKVSSKAPTPGIVQLVGTGPGNPDLLTLRALQVMQRADVAIHDRRIGSQILDLLRRDAERVEVDGLAQGEINELLAGLAEAGKRVVRLKDGDPFVFGRGGEELAFLRRRGIATEAVPGITAALGCAASVGLSLTHRDYAQAVTLIAGEGEDGI